MFDVIITYLKVIVNNTVRFLFYFHAIVLRPQKFLKYHALKVNK